MNDLASAADFLQAYVERLTDISQSDCPDEGICLLGDTRLQYMKANLAYCKDYDKCAKLLDAKNLTLSFDRVHDEVKKGYSRDFSFKTTHVFIYSAVQSPSATAESSAIGARLAEMMLENAKLDDFKGFYVDSFFCQV